MTDSVKPSLSDACPPLEKIPGGLIEVYNELLKNPNHTRALFNGAYAGDQSGYIEGRPQDPFVLKGKVGGVNRELIVTEYEAGSTHPGHLRLYDDRIQQSDVYANLKDSYFRTHTRFQVDHGKNSLEEVEAYFKADFGKPKGTTPTVEKGFLRQDFPGQSTGRIVREFDYNFSSDGKISYVQCRKSPPF